MLYTLRFFFSSKCSLFHNANVFGSCIIHILYTGCAEIKKNDSGAKRLNKSVGSHTATTALYGVNSVLIQYNSTYPNAGYPDRQLS